MSHGGDLRKVLALVEEIQEEAERGRKLWVKAVDGLKAKLTAERKVREKAEYDRNYYRRQNETARAGWADDASKWLSKTEGLKAELTEAYARRDVVRATHAETRKELRAEMEGIIVNAFETRTTDYQADVDWPGVIEDIELALAVVDKALGIPTEQETP